MKSLFVDPDRHRSIAGHFKVRGAAGTDLGKFYMRAVPDHHEHAQENQLRGVAHEHNIKHAVAWRGVRRDFHPSAKVGNTGNCNAIAREFIWRSDSVRSWHRSDAINGEHR